MLRAGIPVCILTVLAALRATAAELWEDDAGGRGVSLNSTLKASALLWRNPDDGTMYPSASGALSLYRLRFDLDGHWGERVNARFSYEHAGRWFGRDGLTTAGAGILPAADAAPYRIVQLRDGYADEDRFAGAHELDRALVAWHPDWGDVTLGRQAIGLGRGRLFTAVDMFSPFSPLEIDREWRRGVDAARAECRLSPTTAVEALGVFAESWDDCAWLVRGRGYFGRVDAEVVGGKRCEDEFLALVASCAVVGAELHGEYAVFRLPEEHPAGGSLFGDSYAPQAVVGASYTLDVGNGLTLLGEYHYSGLGARDMADVAALYADPSYQERLRRGDMQILGRHAAGVQVGYPLNESVNLGANIFICPKDGSGLLSPSLRWDFSRAGSLTVAGYLPWGDEPEAGVIQSEFGASPRGAFLQLGIYL